VDVGWDIQHILQPVFEYKKLGSDLLQIWNRQVNHLRHNRDSDFTYDILLRFESVRALRVPNLGRIFAFLPCRNKGKSECSICILIMFPQGQSFTFSIGPFRNHYASKAIGSKIEAKILTF